MLTLAVGLDCEIILTVKFSRSTVGLWGNEDSKGRQKWKGEKGGKQMVEKEQRDEEGMKEKIKNTDW